MAAPTLLSDVIQPAWQALTPEQRTCWHFWALEHPQIDAAGALRTLYGQQAHYQRNAAIAVNETTPLLDDPPPDTTPPPKVLVLTFALNRQLRLGGTLTMRRGYAYLELKDPMPDNTAVVVTQGYDQKRTGAGRPPRVRHVTVILPFASGNVSIIAPDGYFATTSGNNRFATIRGVTAQRRPDLPLGKIRIVNLLNGQTVRDVLKNPFGGAQKKNNRARATQHKPKTGNHYP